jgi:hypothetical protein
MKKRLIILCILCAAAAIASPAFAGSWTASGYVYKPALGARGQAEYDSFNQGLERIEALLENIGAAPATSGTSLFKSNGSGGFSRAASGTDYSLPLGYSIGDPGRATLAAALTTIGSGNATLRLPAGTYTIAANTTIPANITLNLEKGAVFSIASGKTLTINGGLEVGLYQIFSWSGTGKVVFGAGAVKEVYPEWWATNTTPGTTDMTTAVQAALTTGKKVSMVGSSYLISAALNCTVDGQHITGAGIKATTIIQDTDAIKIFNITAEKILVENISLDYSTTSPASGATAIFSSGAENVFRNFKINRAHVGLTLDTGVNQSARDFHIYSCGYVSLWIHNAGGVYINEFMIDAITTTNASLANIFIQDFAEAIVITNGNIFNGVRPMATAATVYKSKTRPAYCRFTNVYFESFNNSVYLNKIVSSEFIGCWFSAGKLGGGVGNPGCNLNITDQISFTGCVFNNCGSHGVLISANSDRISFVNCTADGNGVTATGGANGFVFANKCTHFQLIGSKATKSLFVGTQNYGVTIGDSCTNFIISGNNLLNNLSGSLFLGAGTSGGVIKDNLGYNPVGGTGITIGASPFTYTAGPSPETVYISGGTVSLIVSSGVSIFNSTNHTIILGPNESVQVTYSSIPYMKKVIH